MTTIPTERVNAMKKGKKIMNKIKIHSKNFGGKRTPRLASKIFFALTLFVVLGLSNSVWAYELDRKALKEESIMDFPKQDAFTPLSYSQSQREGYFLGIKMKFEVFTIWSTPKDKLKSELMINKYFGGKERSDEFPMKIEGPADAKAAKLIEIRF